MSTHAYAPSRRGTIYLTCLSDTPFDLMVPSRQVIKVRSGLEVVLGPRALSDAIHSGVGSKPLVRPCLWCVTFGQYGSDFIIYTSISFLSF